MLFCTKGDKPGPFCNPYLWIGIKKIAGYPENADPSLVAIVEINFLSLSAAAGEFIPSSELSILGCSRHR